MVTATGPQHQAELSRGTPEPVSRALLDRVTFTVYPFASVLRKL